jgi:hypothetical protein
LSSWPTMKSTMSGLFAISNCSEGMGERQG